MGCGGGWASTPRSVPCWPAGASMRCWPSGCCSRWWPTGRWPRRRSWPRPAGSPTMSPSTGWRRSARTPATGRWTPCSTWKTHWLGPSTTPSPTCSTSRSTCCSSTPPPATSNSTSPMRRCPETSAAGSSIPKPAPASRPKRRGSAATASPRTTATTCPRWWSGWPSPAPGSRGGGGAGRATPPTPRSSARAKTTRGAGRWPGGGGACGPATPAAPAPTRKVKDALRDGPLAGVVGVAARGSAPAANRRYLTRAGGHYILGERLRSGSAEAAAALARPGRYRQVADNLQVKEVRLPDDVGAGDRFVVCFNPEAAERDKAVRERLVASLAETIAGTDRLTATKRAELRGQLSTKPGLHRYLKTTPGGLLRIDAKATAAEARLDGKFLLRSSDPHLSAEDIAVGYKQLLAVERGWRDMKQIIDLRPIYHRREDRIRAHVLLCWLALLLIRTIETTTGRTWTTVRAELQRLHVGPFPGPAGTFRQRTELTTEQKAILTALGLPDPPRVLTATPTAA